MPRWASVPAGNDKILLLKTSTTVVLPGEKVSLTDILIEVGNENDCCDKIDRHRHYHLKRIQLMMTTTK